METTGVGPQLGGIARTFGLAVEGSLEPAIRIFTS